MGRFFTVSATREPPNIGIKNFECVYVHVSYCTSKNLSQHLGGKKGYKIKDVHCSTMAVPKMRNNLSAH